MMKKIVFYTLLFLSYSIYADTPIKTIRFATEATYPPFEYIDATGEIKGFDISVAEAMCQQIKAQCSFSNQAFASLIPSLQLGKFDAIISALGITKEREKQVAFTEPYYHPSAAFVGPLSKNYSLTDIEGKTIGVQQATTFQNYLQAKFGNQVSIKLYASIQDAFLDLSSGRVDAVLSDTPIAKAWLKQNTNDKKFGIIGQPIVDEKYFGSGYGIAVNKNATDLLHTLNAALNEIKKNGTYEKIVRQYF